MAAKDEAQTIAFPTLGCGNLKYNPRDVADCFVRAAKNSGTRLQVIG